MTPNQRKAVIASAIALAAPAEGLRQSLPAPLASFYKPTGGLIFVRNGVLGTYRRLSGFFKRPSAICNSVIKNTNWDPVYFGHFSPRNIFRGHVNNSSVSRLLLTGGPCAVIRVVSKAVISSLYRKFVGITGGYGPCVERLERRPLMADCNSFTSVDRVRFIPTSFEHIAPANVDSRALHSMRSRSVPYRRPRPLASAGNAFPASEVSANNNSIYSARTSTEPSGSATGFIHRFFNNYPLSEFSTRHLDKPRVFHNISSGGFNA